MSDVLSGTGVPTNDPKNIHDMTAFIQQSLTDMQGKFTNMSDQVKIQQEIMIFFSNGDLDDGPHRFNVRPIG